jgi:hypothetical protein
VGWSNTVSEPAFGSSGGGDVSVKSKLINLTTSVRTLMRSTFPFLKHNIHVKRREYGLTDGECSTADCDKFDSDSV